MANNEAPPPGRRSRRRGTRAEAISLLEVQRRPATETSEHLSLVTDPGAIPAFYHPALPEGRPGPAAVVWVGGARGGYDGPAGGLYRDLAETLRRYGISSVRLHYRRPNELGECVTDVLVALAWLADEGVQRAALVGHSFGGAVVITAGALNPLVALVVPLSSQTFGAELVDQLSPRQLLLVHGTADTVLPDRCSLPTLRPGRRAERDRALPRRRSRPGRGPRRDPRPARRPHRPRPDPRRPRAEVPPVLAPGPVTWDVAGPFHCWAYAFLSNEYKDSGPSPSGRRRMHKP